MANLRTKLLKCTEDAKKALVTPFKVQKEKKQLESFILDREQQIAEFESDIEELKAADELNIDRIINKRDDIDIEKRRLKLAQELMEELFLKDVKDE